jgi:hypothetical protein
MKRLLPGIIMLAAGVAGAAPLEVIEPIVPATCVVPGTRMIAPCAFMAAMMEKMRNCMGAGRGGCGGGCSGDTCPVKL